MGLSTASISIGNRTTVITKKRMSDEILINSVDVNIIKIKNKFVKLLRNADYEEVKMFNEYVNDKSGTIVIIEDCIGIKNKNLKQFSNKMKPIIARVYRKFMNKIDFFVNDEKIEMEDPLYLDDKRTQRYSDENYEITWKDRNGIEKKSSVNIKLTIVPDFGKDGAKQRKINIPNQGFSILRNSREIVFGYMPKWVSKHNKYNRFRGEISFLSEMDNAMGVRFTKNGIDMMDSVSDKFQEYLKGQIAAISNIIEKEKNKVEDSDIIHENAEKGINIKSNILITPREEDSEYDYNEDDDSNNNEENINEKNQEKSKEKDVKVKFITESAGRTGNIFNAHLQGKTTVIEWNIDHPFYERFVILNKDNASLVTAVDYLIYSIASSQLKVLGDDNNKAEIIYQLISVMSNNMRALLD